MFSVLDFKIKVHPPSNIFLYNKPTIILIDYNKTLILKLYVETIILSMDFTYKIDGIDE